MIITTIEQAFAEIEKMQERVPFEAIEFLYNHERCDEITDKIAFSLENAYNDDVFYDEEEYYFSPAPLWYAIVAENHLSEKLVQPIIKLFTEIEDEDWDYLNEQGGYLIAKISKELGEKVTDTFLDAILESAKLNFEGPVLFLHNSVPYIDSHKNAAKIYEILENKDWIWIDSFVTHLTDTQNKEFIPRIKELLAYYVKTYPQAHEIIELKEAIRILENPTQEDKDYHKKWFENRGHWKEVYKNFYAKKTHQLSINQPKPKEQKIGRNDPCPCGSGKKFKKCCIKLYEGKG